MLIYGPVFYLWRNRTYCALLLSDPIPKSLVIRYLPAEKSRKRDMRAGGGKRKPIKVDISQLLRSSDSSFVIFPGTRYLVFELEKILSLKTRSRRTTLTKNTNLNFVFYNFFADGEPLIGQFTKPLKTRRRNPGESTYYDYRLVGPASVFANKRALGNWVFGSCNDQYKSKSVVAKLKLEAEKLLSTMKQPVGICLMGDQIYTDSKSPDRPKYLPILRRLVSITFGPMTHISDRLMDEQFMSTQLAVLDRLNSKFSVLEYFANFCLFYGNGVNLLKKDQKSNKALQRLNLDDRNLSGLLHRVPVAMQWDDHDVTDDWYLNSLWKKNAQKVYSAKNRKLSEMYPCLIAFQAPYLFLGRQDLVSWARDSIERYSFGNSRKRPGLNIGQVEESIKQDVSYNLVGDTLILESRFNREYKSSKISKLITEFVMSESDLKNRTYRYSGYVSRFREIPGYFDSLATIRKIISGIEQNHLREIRSFPRGVKHLVIATPIVSHSTASYFQKRLIRDYDVSSPLLIDSTLDVGNRFGLGRILREEVDVEPWDLYEGDLIKTIDLLSQERLIGQRTRIIGGDVHYGLDRRLDIKTPSKRYRSRSLSVSALSDNVKFFENAKKVTRFLNLFDRYYWQDSYFESEDAKYFIDFQSDENMLMFSIYNPELSPLTAVSDFVQYLELLLSHVDDRVNQLYSEMGDEIERLPTLAKPAVLLLIIEKFHARVRVELEKKTVASQTIQLLKTKPIKKLSSYRILGCKMREQGDPNFAISKENNGWSSFVKSSEQ